MVIFYCLLLLAGIILGQVIDLSGNKEIFSLVTSVCLAYIMIEVGLEFSVEKRRLSSYGWDAVVALSAAVLPSFLWIVYFILILNSSWKPALLSGLSCAPTSAGVLFSMMMAAGLSATWVFKKARVLAVLDDLATILLLTPLQIIIGGFHWQSITALLLIFAFLYVSFRYQNSINLPYTENWLLLYAVVLTGIVFVVKSTTHVHLEVLIPAFMWGCMVHMPQAHHNPVKRILIKLDTVVKALFMFLVGLSFPKVTVGTATLSMTLWHVLALTILSNLGKCFPLFCYRTAVPLKERLALSVAMFPRGEVGAAVLIIGLGYGFSGYVTTLAMLSLAVNLVLTGLFVWTVIKLLNMNTNEARVTLGGKI